MSKQEAHKKHPWASARERRAEHYKRLWEQEGTLYTDQDEEDMARDVLAELEREHGPMRSSLPVRKYSAGQCWSPPANWKERPRKAKAAKPKPKPVPRQHRPTSSDGPRQRYLEDATVEEIRAVVVHGPRNMTTNSRRLELETRELLAETLCMLKRKSPDGGGIGAARMQAHDLAWAYVMKSSCPNRAIKGLVMQHVTTVLQYGWFVYSKLAQQEQ